MNFFILWTALGEYEWVENYPDCGGGDCYCAAHEYAWGHKYYGKSNYIILPMLKYPEEFSETPEDTLLDSIFGQNRKDP